MPRRISWADDDHHRRVTDHHRLIVPPHPPSDFQLGHVLGIAEQGHVSRRPQVDLPRQRP